MDDALHETNELINFAKKHGVELNSK